MKLPTGRLTTLAAGAALFLVAGAVRAEVSLPSTELVPVVPGDPETRSTPFIASSIELEPLGYVEEEYLVSGAASVYMYTDDEGQSSEVEVAQADVAYTTRMLVRRPQSPQKSSGTVYLEILNATAGWDGDPIWQNTSALVTREGSSWVGLTTKPVAADFLRDKWGRSPFAPRNASRYADISFPHFGQVWDMISQVAALLRSESSENPLRGWRIERIILVGYSQSARYQITYLNSFHADTTWNGSSVIDGYYIAAGQESAKRVRIVDDREGLPPGDARNLILGQAPVIRFQTQTEVIGFGAHAVRQTEADNPSIRMYEMAGGAHVGASTNERGGRALDRDLALPGFGAGCGLPLNPIRIGFAQSALLDALESWVRYGEAPPPSALLELETDAEGKTQIVLDEDGNALGGVRLPTIDAPLGTYLASNTGGGFCYLIGAFEEFDEEMLRARYPSHLGYVWRVWRSAVRSYRQRFLLFGHMRRLMGEALRSDVGR